VEIVKEILEKQKQESSKGKRVKVFFDLDGVLAEIYKFTVDIAEVDFKIARPVKTVVNFARKMHDAGVEVFILGMCFIPHQKNDKREWIAKHISFVKSENVLLLLRSDYPDIDRFLIKSHVLKKHIAESDKVYFVDDTSEELRNMLKNVSGITCFHPTAFIE